MVFPQLPAGPAKRLPENVGILLGPAGLGRDIGPEGDLGTEPHPTVEIENDGLEALGAVVNGQDVVALFHSPS